jgi:Zn-dependent protease
MRRFRFPVGRPLGIQLWIHVSWFAVLGLVIWSVTVAFGSLLPQPSLLERLAMATITGVAFFVCLAVHEIAHAVVARRFGVRVLGITLFMLGGVAEIRGELPSPGSEFAVALAGPGTSVALGSAFAIVSIWAGDAGWLAPEAVLTTLGLVNLGVAVFNLIPGLPLDGGRILRAAIWRRTGSFVRATRVAAVGGRAVAATLVTVGIAIAVSGRFIGLWYGVMGTFVWILASASGRATAPAEGGALALTGEGEAA